MVFFLWLKVSNRMQQTGFAMESCQFPSMDLTPTTPCPDDLDAPVAPPYHLRSSPDLPEIFSGLVLGWGWYLEGFWCCGWDLQKLEGSCPPQGSGLLSAAQKFLVFWPEMAMRIEKFANNKSLIAFFFTKVSFFFCIGCSHFGKFAQFAFWNTQGTREIILLWLYGMDANDIVGGQKNQVLVRMFLSPTEMHNFLMEFLSFFHHQGNSCIISTWFIIAREFFASQMGLNNFWSCTQLDLGLFCKVSRLNSPNQGGGWTAEKIHNV